LDKAGDKPTIAVIKRRWNAHRKTEVTWTYEVESFDLWVDQFDLDWDRDRIPNSGWGGCERTCVFAASS
jgi:hypothetical protein